MEKEIAQTYFFGFMMGIIAALSMQLIFQLPNHSLIGLMILMMIIVVIFIVCLFRTTKLELKEK